MASKRQLSENQRYYVMIVDLVGSQLLQDREDATDRLKKAIRQLNETFYGDMLSPLEITRGDEVAAVLTRIGGLYEMIDILTATMRPIECRMVVVYDRLTAGLRSKRSTEIDGPAFYRADEAMKELKSTREWFRLSTGQLVTDDASSGLINLILFHKVRMTDFQFEVVRLYSQGVTQAAIAQQLHRTQQQVSQVTRSVRIGVLQKAEKAARQLLVSYP